MKRNEENNIRVFDTQREVLAEIEALKAEGHREADIYVLANSYDRLTLIKSETNVQSEAASGEYDDWMSKLRNLFSKKSDDDLRIAFDRMEFEETEKDQFYNNVRSGQILLFVDDKYKIKASINDISNASKASDEENEGHEEDTGMDNEAYNDKPFNPVNENQTDDRNSKA